nr:hypothetical protein [uncultured Draconibacterium sp.]
MSLVQIGGKVQASTRADFLEIRGDKTWEEILSAMIKAYLYKQKNGQQSEIPEGYISPEDHAQAIQLKNNEIGELKTAHTLEIEAKDSVIEGLENQLKTLKLPPETKPNPDKANLVIEINRFSHFVLSDEIQAYKKKHGVELELGELLFSYFLHMKKTGKVEPVYLWTEREFLQHKERFSTPAADE